MNYLVKFTDSNIKNIILNICIFLFGINFLYKNNYVVFATFVLLFVFKRLKIKWGNIKILAVLILFALSWLIFSPGHELSGICLPICYLIGANIEEDDEKGTIKFVLLVSFSLAFYTTLFFINNAFVNGLFSYDVTNQPNIWTGNPLWPTNIMLYSSLFFSCSGYILFKEKSIFTRLIYLLLFIVNAYYALMLGRRAALLMIILSLGMSFLYKLFIDRSDKKKTIKLFLTVFIIGILCLLLLAVFYKFDIFGFKAIIQGTDLYNRFIGQTGLWRLVYDMGRSSLRKEFLSYFWKYPWGGSYIHELINNYAHDVWLDAYDVAGIFALIFILIYSVIYAVRLIKIVINKKNSHEIRVLALCILVCTIAQLSLEPIMEACKSYMYGVCMIHGSFELLTRDINA